MLQACYLRGLNSTLIAEERCRTWLAEWLQISCNLKGKTDLSGITKIQVIFVFYSKIILGLFIYFRDFIYLFLERGREGERKGEKHQCVVASRAPPTGDPAHVSWLGIKPATLWFPGQRSIHWAILARAILDLVIECCETLLSHTYLTGRHKLSSLQGLSR